MSNPTFGLPSPTLPVSNPQTGMLASVWYQFFVRLSQLSAERPIAPLTVGASPFAYTASTIGHLFISGGTVFTILLARSGVTVSCPGNAFIPMAANDTITATFSVAPTITFIPSARG